LFVSTLKKTPPTPEKKQTLRRDITTIFVREVSPPPTQTLVAGQLQKFTVTLDASVDVGKLRINIVSSPPSDISSQSPVPFTKGFSGRKLEISTTQTTLPVTTYTITLAYNDKVILQQSYLSSPEAPTPVANNNVSLSQFLPYETLNYLLEYNKGRNIYIVHVRYDPNSKKDLTTQFNDAKSNANNFIESRGVDLKSIVIEYIFK
jgi:hypothetical protein